MCCFLSVAAVQFDALTTTTMSTSSSPSTALSFNNPYNDWPPAEKLAETHAGLNCKKAAKT
jgi:hypothetical protein